MKPLQDNYRLFTLLNICSPDKPTNYRTKLFTAIISILCPIVASCFLIGSFVFVSKYFSTDLAYAICAIFQIAAVVTVLYTLIMAHVNRQDLKSIFHVFEHVYEASMWRH